MAAEETTLQTVLEEFENLKKIVSQQQTKIGSLEENLTEQNRNLKKIISQQQTKIGSMEENLTEQNRNLMKIISQQQTKIGSLEENLKSVTEQNRQLQEEVVHLKSDQEVIKEKMNLKQTIVPNRPKNFGGEPRKISRGTDDMILSRHKRLLTQSSPEVGFTALRHQTSVVVHTNAIIIFETSITNAGSAYNPSSGIFRAPANGLYVFFFDIECASNNGNTQAELVRDGAKTGVQAYCHGSGDVDNSSTLGVLHLSAGDTVWVRLFYGDHITFGGKTLFSGFLL